MCAVHGQGAGPASAVVRGTADHGTTAVRAQKTANGLRPLAETLPACQRPPLTHLGVLRAEFGRLQRGNSASMADALKAQGNTAFKEGRYQESIGYFTSAIDLDSGNHILYSNTAFGSDLEDAHTSDFDAVLPLPLPRGPQAGSPRPSL